MKFWTSEVLDMIQLMQKLDAMDERQKDHEREEDKNHRKFGEAAQRHMQVGLLHMLPHNAGSLNLHVLMQALQAVSGLCFMLNLGSCRHPMCFTCMLHMPSVLLQSLTLWRKSDAG